MVRTPNAAKTGAALALSGVLVFAFAPAVTPAALAASADSDTASGESLETVETATAKIQNALERNTVEKDAETVIGLYNDVIVAQGAQDNLTNEQLQYVVTCMSYELESAQSQNAKLQRQVTRLQKRLATANAAISSSERDTLKNKTKIKGLKADASKMGKVTLTWKASNAIDGMRYQVTYRKGSDKAKVATAKTAKKTLAGLAGGASYSFQVRAFKKLDGKKVYSKKSKKVTAKVIPVYTTGSYKVTADMLHVRKATSTTSDLLVDIKNATNVRVTKLKVVNGVVWGQLTYGGQTGWVQMKYLKKS